LTIVTQYTVASDRTPTDVTDNNSGSDCTSISLREGQKVAVLALATMLLPGSATAAVTLPLLSPRHTPQSALSITYPRCNPYAAHCLCYTGLLDDRFSVRYYTTSTALLPCFLFSYLNFFAFTGNQWIFRQTLMQEQTTTENHRIMCLIIYLCSYASATVILFF